MTDHRTDCRSRFPGRRGLFLPALGAALALVAAPAAAAEEGPAAPAPVEQAVEELRRMMERLDDLFRSMPRYAMPEVTEDGDIIIRRIDPSPDRPAREGPDGAIDL